MRVLIIEDDSATAQSMEMMLRAHGFNVITTDLGTEGISLAKLYDYDAITLDINLPDMSGWEVIKILRQAKVMTPILVVSGMARVDDKVRALELGADDYLTKPFHGDEMNARLHALIRRVQGRPTQKITIGPLTIDITAKSVMSSGKKVHLSGKEYALFELLASRCGMTLTKEMIMNHLYGGRDEPELKIIDVFICRLRKKITAATGDRNVVQTVWGRGYTVSENESADEQPHVPASRVSEHAVAA